MPSCRSPSGSRGRAIKSYNSRGRPSALETNGHVKLDPIDSSSQSESTSQASTPENGHANGHSFRAEDDDDELDDGAGDRGEESGSEAEGDASDGRGEYDGSGSDEKRSSSSSSTVVGVCVRWLLLSSAALWAIWLVVGASLLYMLRAHIRLPEPFSTGFAYLSRLGAFPPRDLLVASCLISFLSGAFVALELWHYRSCSVSLLEHMASFLWRRRHRRRRRARSRSRSPCANGHANCGGSASAVRGGEGDDCDGECDDEDELADECDECRAAREEDEALATDPDELASPDERHHHHHHHNNTETKIAINAFALLRGAEYERCRGGGSASASSAAGSLGLGDPLTCFDMGLTNTELQTMFTFNADALRMASPVASFSSADIERECELQELMAAAWREERADGRIRRAREALHHHHCSLVPPFSCAPQSTASSTSSTENGSKRAIPATQQQQQQPQPGGKCARPVSNGTNANGTTSCFTCEICSGALGISASSRSDSGALMTSLTPSPTPTPSTAQMGGGGGGGASPNLSSGIAISLYAPALVLLAEELAPTVTEAERLYRLALRHAEAQLKRSSALAHQSPDFESLHRRDMNLVIYTKRKCAMCLRRLNRERDSIKMFKELLKEHDHMASGVLSVHENLLEALLEIQAFTEAQTLLGRYDAITLPKSAMICYTAALFKLKACADRLVGVAQSGSKRNLGTAEAAAIDALYRAFEFNPHVPEYLLELRPLEPPSEHVQRRGDSEALAYAFANLRHWKRIDAALGAPQSPSPASAAAAAAAAASGCSGAVDGALLPMSASSSAGGESSGADGRLGFYGPLLTVLYTAWIGPTLLRPVWSLPLRQTTRRGHYFFPYPSGAETVDRQLMPLTHVVSVHPPSLSQRLGLAALLGFLPARVRHALDRARGLLLPAFALMSLFRRRTKGDSPKLSPRRRTLRRRGSFRVPAAVPALALFSLSTALLAFSSWLAPELTHAAIKRLVGLLVTPLQILGDWLERFASSRFFLQLWRRLGG